MVHEKNIFTCHNIVHEQYYDGISLGSFFCDLNRTFSDCDRQQK